ncbi:hypothetical protein QBC32DRAFT_34 [Pseudoneurospora amorphoporcata]|uniref:Rho termination factor N-terminal domain-containing protein n=1 Tax=Pseudoneurospora amorphoporcata TaxID=241081 RepID=A0AAN6P578_9PEZI|nr:hypothetical protein QBC32DRAFT_34 [Pseudoneurospora amorphoporcata]
MSGTTNSWLARQRKSDLVELAREVGVTGLDGLKKNDIEQQLDNFLSQNANRFSSDSRFTSYFNSRARQSPIKRESDVTPNRVPRRRTTNKVEVEIPAAATIEESDSIPSTTSPSPEPETKQAPAPSEVLQAAAQVTQEALVSTAQSAVHNVQNPGHALSRLNNTFSSSTLHLPASQAELAQVVESGTLAVRNRVSDLYQKSGIHDKAETVRESLSTVNSVAVAVAAFELYFLRKEVIPDRYAFTIPAVKLLGGMLGWDECPIYVPDMFALVTAGFWIPALVWTTTSLILPSLFGYFFNLSVAHSNSFSTNSGPTTRKQSRELSKREPEYAVDPVTFSIVKALITYVVYAQGVTFRGWLDADAVARINGALYSGWKGVLVGAAVTGIAGVYDAVLRK